MGRIPAMLALAGAGAALLAGCAAPPDHVVSCMFELDPPGAYEWPSGDAVPTVAPATGGTPEGAAALNACVRARAAAAGEVPDPAAPPAWFTGWSSARAVGDAVTVTRGSLSRPSGRGPSQSRPTEPAVPAASLPSPARARPAEAASTPAVAAEGAPSGAADRLRAGREADPLSCPLQMVGGTGYACGR